MVSETSERSKAGWSWELTQGSPQGAGVRGRPCGGDSLGLACRPMSDMAACLMSGDGSLLHEARASRETVWGLHFHSFLMCGSPA